MLTLFEHTEYSLFLLKMLYTILQSSQSSEKDAKIERD